MMVLHSMKIVGFVKTWCFIGSTKNLVLQRFHEDGLVFQQFREDSLALQQFHEDGYESTHHEDLDYHSVTLILVIVVLP